MSDLRCDAFENPSAVSLPSIYPINDPPLRVYAADTLFIRTMNSVAASLQITVRMRFIFLNQFVKEEEKVFSGFDVNSASETRLIPLMEIFEKSFPLASSYRSLPGYLVSIGIFNSDGVVRRGDLFIQFGLLRFSRFLISDYLSPLSGLSWPGSRIVSSREGPGRMILDAGPDPAAGAELVRVVPDNRFWKISTIRFRLVTSAVAGDRRVQLYFTNAAAVTYGLFTCPDIQPANSTRDYTAAHLGAQIGAPSLAPIGTQLWINIPPELKLEQAHTINTSTLGFDATAVTGDNYTAPQTYVEDYKED